MLRCLFMNTIETQATTPVPVNELPIPERFSAWKQKLNNLEGARMALFKEGEAALADGLQALGLKARGTEVQTSDIFKTLVTRQPLVLPDRNSGPSYVHDFSFPEELKGLIGTIHLREYSLKAQAVIWLDTPKFGYVFDSLTLGGQVSNESFELSMGYKRKPTYYLERVRRDDEIVSFHGHYTKGFEREIDRIKDLNRSDANTKLSFALGLIQLVSDLRVPPSIRQSNS